MVSMPRLRRRFWLESFTAVLAALLTLLTLVRPDWIELVFEIDPDAGSGSIEWLIVVTAAGIALVTSAGALTEWRRFRRLAGTT